MGLLTEISKRIRLPVLSALALCLSYIALKENCNFPNKGNSAENRANQVSQEKHSSLEQKLSRDIKSTFGENPSGWYAKTIGKGEPRVILIADEHNESIQTDHFLPIIDIASKYAGSIGLEFGNYGQGDPFEIFKAHEKASQEELDKELRETKVGLRPKTRDGESKTLQRIKEGNLKRYSLEVRKHSDYIALEALIAFQNICNRNKFEVFKQKNQIFLSVDEFSWSDLNKLYNIARKHSPALPELTNKTLLNKSECDKFSERLNNYFNQEIADRRSVTAALILKDYTSKNSGITLAFYGAGHKFLISKILENKGISHVVISNRELDTLTEKPKSHIRIRVYYE